MKKEEMKEVARDVFERIDGVEKVFVTSDGQAFVDEHYAKSHALHNRDGKELSMETFLKSEIFGSDADNGKPGERNNPQKPLKPEGGSNANKGKSGKRNNSEKSLKSESDSNTDEDKSGKSNNPEEK